MAEPSKIGPTEVNAPLNKQQEADPTELTTRAVDRAVAQLIALFEQRFRAIEERADRALMMIDKRPSEVDLRIATERELTNEKFKGVDQGLSSRDISLTAAFVSQKISVDDQNRSNTAAAAKAEATTVKQIDSIQTMLAQQAKTFDDKMTDVKERVQMIEGRSRGIGDSWGWLVGMVGLVGAVIAIGLALGVGK